VQQQTPEASCLGVVLPADSGRGFFLLNHPWDLSHRLFLNQADALP